MGKRIKIALIFFVFFYSINLQNYKNNDMEVSAASRHSELHIRDGAHSLLLKRDGTVWGWGDNSSGQLGIGTISSFEQNMVQTSGLTNVVKITSGISTSFALKEDGTVWSWGSNGYHNIGDGTTINRVSPVQVLGENGVGFFNRYS